MIELFKRRKLVSFTWMISVLSCINAIPLNAGEESALDLILLHNNDLHGHSEETCIDKGGVKNCFGGFGRISSVVKQYRNDYENGNGAPVLFLNAGDTYTGTPWFGLFKDQISSEMMNALKPDAGALGNHEFDYGVSGLVPFLDHITFPILMSNFNISNDHPLMKTHAIKPSVVFDFKGVQIGVIGYLLPETKEMAKTEDVEFVPEIEAINREAEELNRNGVKIIFALGHSGYDKDQEIARDCPLVDVVVGAHSHSFLYTGTPPDSDYVEGPYPTLIEQPSGKKVPVVQAYAYSKYLGKMELSFDKNGNLLHWKGAPIFLDSSISRDPEIMTILNKYRAVVEPMTKDIVGIAKTDLKRSASSESNLGNLIADAFVYNRVQQYSGSGWTDAPIAIVNSGGIRDVAYKGNVSVYDLFTILPFENILIQVTVPGYVLRQAFERTVEDYEENGYIRRFLQISGARVVFDVEQPLGHRVKSLDVLCGNCSVPSYRPLDDNKLYGVVMDSYIYSGGDGFTMFEGFKGIEMNITPFNATYNYMKQIKLLYPAIEGRTKIITANKSNAVSAVSASYSIVMILTSFVIAKFLTKS